MILDLASSLCNIEINWIIILFVLSFVGYSRKKKMVTLNMV